MKTLNTSAPTVSRWAARVACALFVVAALQGSTPPPAAQAASDEGVWTVYSNANEVMSLALDPQTGDLWAATRGGVVKWDVKAGTYRKFTSMDGLANTALRAIAIDANTGDKWFGTDGGGVSRLDAAGHWTTFTTADGLADNYVPAAAIDPSSGDKWFGTYGGGVSRLDASGGWTTFTTADGLAANDVLSVAIDPSNGDKWFGTFYGVSRLASSGRWTTYTTANGLADNYVQAIAIDMSSGDKWFGAGSGVNRLDASGRWTTFTDGHGASIVHSIAIDVSSGEKWFAASDGAFRLDASGRWMPFTVATGLVSSDVWSIAIDPHSGDKWFGTWSGVSLLDALGSWTTFSTADVLVDNYVTALSIDSITGDKWFATGSGASRLDASGHWTPFKYKPKDGLAANWLTSMAIDASNGDKWFGTNGWGVSRLAASGRWTTFTIADGLANITVKSVAIDPTSGDKWFGTEGGGVSRLDASGRWTTFTTANGLAHNDVWSIAIDPRNGDKWFGTWPNTVNVSDGGVSRLDASGRWTTFTTADGLANNTVWSIAIDPNSGDKWFGTRWGGVSRMDASGRWTTFTTDDGLAHNNVGAIFIDARNGDKWFGTWGGVSRLDASGRWTTFTAADGLADMQVFAIALDRRTSEMWFGTWGGVSHLAPRPPSTACASSLLLPIATETLADITSPDGLTFAFDIPDPFTRIEIAIPDLDDRLSLTLSRSCDTNVGTGSGRHIGTDQRLVLDVTNQTGRYYLEIVPKPDVALSDLPLRVRVKLGVTRIDPRLVRTLVITHQPRIQALYGLNATSPELVAWRDSVQRLAAHPSVGGHVIWNIEEETSPAVAAAYQRWLDQPREVDRANDVAVALRDWIWSARQSLTYVQYVVLLGDDRVIPHLRLAVRSSGERADGWVGEDRYMDEGGVDAASGVGAALLQNRTLTDDVYAAPAPISWGDGQSLYLPEIAVGRLVERPADMTAVMQAFLASDGQTTLKRSLVAGYDFMQDATDQADGLFAGRGVPADMRTHLTGTDWSADALLSVLRGPRTDVAFLAAHADHHGYALPRRSRLNAADLATGGDLAGLIAYALACHGGLNVPGTEHTQALDLPEAWLRRGATYIGTSGWAYGLPHVLAYEEQLMVDFTAALTNGDGGAVGDSLVDAKRRYAREHALTAMHAKTLAGTVLYGLPMQRLRVERAAQVPDNVFSADVAVATSATPTAAGKAVHSAAQQVGGDVYSISSRYPLASSGVDRVDTADGSYFSFSGLRPLAEAGQAVQPQMQVVLGEINRDSRIFTPRSAVLTGATYRDLPGFPPLIQAAQTFSPQHALAARTAQADVKWVPDVPVHVRRLERTARTGALLFAREEATLLLTAGQYHGASGVERLFEAMELDQYYSSAADTQAPMIEAVHTSADPRGQVIRARLNDASGIARAVAAYDAGGGAWRSVELTAGADGEWGGVVPGDGSWLLQVVDKAGNTGVVSDAGAAAPPGPEFPDGRTAYLPYARR